MASPPRRSGKRKRTPPSMGTDSIINPFSRSPGERLQLSVAGLSDTDEDPTRRIKHFPHRKFDPAADHGTHSDDDDAPQRDGNLESRTAAAGGGGGGGGSYLDVLLRSVHHFLDRGDIAKAARAYGLLLQLRPRSRPIDVRQHNLWAIGAEILMREGETPPHQHSNAYDNAARGDDEGGHSHSHDHGHMLAGFSHTPATWGFPANINKVKVYFETLIQRHPYDHKFPSSISALDFQLALLGCEIYNVHAQHKRALTRAADEQAGAWFGNHLAQEPPDRHNLDVLQQKDHERWPISEARKDELRIQALAAMRDITQKMDTLMPMLPYSKNNYFLRLRATASLYMADLVMPVSQTTPTERYEAERTRRLERKAAINALDKLVKNGAELDRATQAMLDDAETDERQMFLSPSPLFPSLPIRNLS